MRVEGLLESIEEAKRFLKRAQALEAELKKSSEYVSERKKKNPKYSYIPYYLNDHSGKLTASVKRGSLDLTRALASFRRSYWLNEGGERLP
jgi:hypothetical protein